MMVGGAGHDGRAVDDELHILRGQEAPEVSLKLGNEACIPGHLHAHQHPPLG